MQTIRDQASDLEHGWREAVQNGIDSPGSTEVHLDFDHQTTVVWDDGEGVDLSSERGLSLLKNLGATSKDRDDDSTIGQFGIGKGQIIAKGRTAFVSGDTALVFDVEQWGLELIEVDASEVGEYVETRGYGVPDKAGLAVVVNHYEGEVPSQGHSRWDDMAESIEARFRYVSETTGVDVHVNGEMVSDGDPFRDMDSQYAYAEVEEVDGAGKAVFALKAAKWGGVRIYSNGVYVKTDWSLGVTGRVITYRNMDLDFARDDIKSGCPVWNAVRDRLTEVRGDLFESTPSNILGDDARRFIVEWMARDPSDYDRFKDKAVLRTADERNVSLADVASKGQVGVAGRGNAAADRLSEAYGMTVLDEDDEATMEVMETFVDEVPETYDAQEKADELGLMKKGRPVDPETLNTVQEKKLKTARELADRLGIMREVRYGESDVAAAWTNGTSYVYITDGAAPSRNRAAWVWELAETLVHESCHNRSTMDGCSHGRDFDKKYRREWMDATRTVAEFITEVEREGLADVVGGIDVVRPDMPSWDEIKEGR